MDWPGDPEHHWQQFSLTRNVRPGRRGPDILGFRLMSSLVGTPPSSVVVNTQGRGSWFEACSGVRFPRRRPCGVAINALVDLINWLGNPKLVGCLWRSFGGRRSDDGPPPRVSRIAMCVLRIAFFSFVRSSRGLMTDPRAGFTVAELASRVRVRHHSVLLLTRRSKSDRVRQARTAARGHGHAGPESPSP